MKNNHYESLFEGGKYGQLNMASVPRVWKRTPKSSDRTATFSFLETHNQAKKKKTCAGYIILFFLKKKQKKQNNMLS